MEDIAQPAPVDAASPSGVPEAPESNPQPEPNPQPESKPQPESSPQPEQSMMEDANTASREDASAAIITGPKIEGEITPNMVFANAAEALAAVTPKEPEMFSDHDDSKTPVSASGKKRKSSGPVRKTSAPALPKRPRSSSSKAKYQEEDTEPEVAGGPKIKRRKTVAGGSLEIETEVRELSFLDLPPGWTAPLLYFATMGAYGDGAYRAWKRYPERTISTGAIYLDSRCTAVPEVEDHVVGPTAVIRDLCAVLKNDNEDQALHERSYVAISRASAREGISGPRKSVSGGGPFAVSGPFTRLGVTMVIRAASEKEYVQFIPLDICASVLVKQIEALSKHAELFPSHLFTSELHTWQYAPTVALHLLSLGMPRKLRSLLDAFASPNGLGALDQLEGIHSAKVGRRVGGRRRGENAVSDLSSFVLEADEKTLIRSLCDDVNEQLQLRKREFVLDAGSARWVTSQAYGAGDQLLQMTVPAVPRASAALRFRVYEYFCLRPFLVLLTEEMVEEENLTMIGALQYYQAKEDEKWLDAFDHACFLDFTISEEQEKWLLSSERIIEHQACPSVTENQKLMYSLLTTTADTETSETSPNVKCVVSMMPNSTGKPISDSKPVHNLIWTLVATRDISSGDEISLGASVTRVDWAEIAKGNKQAYSSEVAESE